MNTEIKKLAANQISMQRSLHQEQCKVIRYDYGEAAARFEHFANEDYYKRIEDFIHLLDSDWRSENPYNNTEISTQLVNDYGILERHSWDSYNDFVRHAGEMQLSSGRQNVLGQYSLIYRHIALIIVSGAPQRYPFILDRDFRVIDGLQRMIALRYLQNCGFYAIRLNYVHSEDRLNQPHR